MASSHFETGKVAETGRKQHYGHIQNDNNMINILFSNGNGYIMNKCEPQNRSVCHDVGTHNHDNIDMCRST